MKFRAILVALFVAVSSFAGINEYRSLHGEAWRNGGVCRHAAALVWKKAKQDGTLAKVILLRVKKPSQYLFHVVPVVFYDGRWHAIETAGGFTRSRKWDGQKDPKWFQSIMPGRRLDAYIGEEPDLLIEKSLKEYEEIIKAKKSPN